MAGEGVDNRSGYSLRLGEQCGTGRVRKRDDGNSRRSNEFPYRLSDAWRVARVVVGQQQVAMYGKPGVKPFKRRESRSVQSNVNVNKRKCLTFETHG